MEITAAKAAELVARKPNISFDGWDLIVIDMTKDGYAHPNGIYVQGKWVRQYRIEMTENGCYSIPRKYERFVR